MRTRWAALALWASACDAFSHGAAKPAPRALFGERDADRPADEAADKASMSAAAVTTTVAAGGVAAAAGAFGAAAGTACVGGVCQIGAGAALSAAATGATATGAAASVGGAAALASQLGAAAGAVLLGLGLQVGSPRVSALEEMASSSLTIDVAFANARPTVVEFYSRDCVHCNEAAKTLLPLKAARVGDTNWVMVDTNDANNRALWESLGVDEIPHFSFFDGEEHLKATAVGAISQQIAEKGILLSQRT
ncbi:hypothetical protein M885DRAFT_529446 [Pelagophyceae sp. CCMP2097]|nr:hypothetical protein M885DRAFT_529446 [Pelagophyceae sp. CCMP2097]